MLSIRSLSIGAHSLKLRLLVLFVEKIPTLDRETQPMMCRKPRLDNSRSLSLSVEKNSDKQFWRTKVALYIYICTRGAVGFWIVLHVKRLELMLPYCLTTRLAKLTIKAAEMRLSYDNALRH